MSQVFRAISVVSVLRIPRFHKELPVISKSARLVIVLPAFLAFAFLSTQVSAQTGQPKPKTATTTTTTTTSTGTATPQGTITGTDPTPIKWPPSAR